MFLSVDESLFSRRVFITCQRLLCFSSLSQEFSSGLQTIDKSGTHTQKKKPPVWREGSFQ